MEFDLIIENGALVTADAKGRIFVDGLVCVTGNEISFAGHRSKYGPNLFARKKINARGGIIMPGLVNSHTHAPMSMFRGLADDLPLLEWLNSHIFPAEARYVDPGLVYAGTRLSCAEMLLSGTTSFCDGYFYENEVARAVLKSGMRAVLGHGILDHPAPGVTNPKNNVQCAVDFAKKWLDRSDRITPSLFCHSPYTCSTQTIIKAKNRAYDLGILFQIHVAETQSEYEQIMAGHDKSPVQYLAELGALDEKTLLVHGIWVDEKDIDTIARHKACVAVATHSEMKLASGIAPIPDYLEAGVIVGLGTDGPASNNSLDMFGEMDLTAKIHKAISKDPTILNAAKIIAMATSQSAYAIGLGKITGSLEKGKRADIIILDTSTPCLTPVYHPESAIVYAASGNNVRHVFVDGKQLVHDKKLVSNDLDDILKEAKNIAAKIKR